jgi:hypothetical protein
MKRLFAAIGTCGLAFGVATAGNPPSPVSHTELVTKLGSDDFREREAAAVALEKAGSAALPALREATNSTNPEVRQRAQEIAFKLQRTVDSTSYIAPKKLALNYRDTPLGVAINDLKARTGLNITLDTNRIKNPLRTVTLVTGELPAWEALDQFCTAAGLKEVFRADLDLPKQPPRRGYVPPPQVPAPDAVPVVLIDGKNDKLPAARDSAMRVTVLPRAFPGHRVVLGTGETTLCFDIAPAPGLNWQNVVGVKVKKLIDDADRPGGAGSPRPVLPGVFDFDGAGGFGGGGFGGGVVVFNGPGGFGGGFGGGMIDPRTGMPIPADSLPNPRIVPVPLKIGTPTARTIKRLEGHVIGEIQLANQTLITLNNPTKNTGIAFDGPGEMRLTVNTIGEPRGNFGITMQVTLQYPSLWSMNARRGFNPGGLWPEVPRPGTQMPTVQAYDATGKLMPYSNSGFTDSNDDGSLMIQQINMTFRKDAGTPAKLVLVGPRPVVVEVPFVMENVPLP